MSGWDIARHARLAIPTLPIVYVCGNSASAWAMQGVRRDDPKPYAFAQIVTALATLMNAPYQLPSQPPATKLS